MAEYQILIVSHSAGFYGAERSLLDVAKGLMDRGLRVAVVVPGSGRLLQELDAADIPVIKWKYYGWLGRKNRLLKGAFRLAFNIISSVLFVARNRSKFSFVYTNTITTPFGVFIATGMGLPHVWHAREFVHEDMGAEFDLPKFVLRKIFLKKLAISIYNSNALKNKFLRYFGTHKSAVVYNGIPLAKVPNKFQLRDLGASSPVKLIMVGSLHEGKGHSDAIDALRLIVYSFPNARLLIVGDGDQDYKASLEMQAEQSNVRSNLVFEGYAENPNELIASADVFLMCSRNEAFGRVTVEAMSTGCPVIGTDSGGTREIIEDGVSGILYEPKNPTDLAKKAIRLIQDKTLRKEISVASKRRSGDFSVEAAVYGVLEAFVSGGVLDSMADQNNVLPGFQWVPGYKTKPQK